MSICRILKRCIGLRGHRTPPNARYPPDDPGVPPHFSYTHSNTTHRRPWHPLEHTFSPIRQDLLTREDELNPEVEPTEILLGLFGMSGSGISQVALLIALLITTAGSAFFLVEFAKFIARKFWERKLDERSDEEKIASLTILSERINERLAELGKRQEG